MGQVGTLVRISQETLDEIKQTKKFDFKKAKQELDVDKLWEPIMFIFGNGILGGQPFINLFMAENGIYQSPDQDKWDPTFRYHSTEDLDKFIVKFDALDEEQIRKRIDIEAINSICMYPISETATWEIELLVKHCLEIITLFKKAKEESGAILTFIG